MKESTSVMSPPLTNKKVSVCMPVYNGGDYIAKAIESILTQTYQNFELIVCDNCSTDDTEKIVRNFKDPRITFFRNEKNLGLVGNANRCLEHATGDYIHILHHDDIMRHNNLELKVQVLNANPNVGFVHSNVAFIDQYGKPLALNKFNAATDYIENGITFFEKYILNMPIGASVFIGAVMARRECYQKLGGFNPTLTNVNDSDMWMRMLLFYDVACIGKRLVEYRLHGMMTSTAINDEEGLNIPGLKEHFLGCKIVMTNYRKRIPNWNQLKKNLIIAFSMQAVTKGIRLIRRGKYAQAFGYIKAGFNFDPIIIFRKAFCLFITTLIIKKVRKLLTGSLDSIA